MSGFRRALQVMIACALISSCAGVPRISAPANTKALYDSDWFNERARQLNLSFDEARSRDRLISDRTPPGVESLDPFTRTQAAAIWAEQCARCHGEDGEPPEQRPHPGDAPRSWGTFGTSMGFFFGGDKMRAGLFKVIFEGGKPKEDGSASAMPAWGETLAREQIWALVYHLESF